MGDGFGAGSVGNVLRWLAQSPQMDMALPPEEEVTPDAIRRTGKNMVAGAAKLPTQAADVALMADAAETALFQPSETVDDTGATVRRSFGERWANNMEHPVGGRGRDELKAGADWWANKVDEFTGAPNKAERTSEDEAAQAFGGMLAPSPTALAGKAVARLAPESAAAAKVAGGLDKLSHLDMGVKAEGGPVGNAINVAAGSMISPLVEAATMPTVAAHERVPSDLPAQDTVDAANQSPTLFEQFHQQVVNAGQAIGVNGDYTAVLAGFGAMLARKDPEAIAKAAAALGKSARVAEDGGISLAKEAARSKGKSFVDAGDVTPARDPETIAGVATDVFRRAEQVVDELAPAHNAMRDAGADLNATRAALNAETLYHRSNVSEAVTLAKTTGQITGVDGLTTSVDMLRNVQKQAMLEGWDKEWFLHRQARTQLDTNNALLKDAEDALAEAKTAYELEPTSSNSKKLREAAEKWEKRKDDAPEVRQAMPEYSREDLQELVRQGDANPKIKAANELYDKGINDQLRARVKNGLMSEEEYQFLRDRNPNFSPQFAEPNKGMTGFIPRSLEIIKRRNGWIENPLSDDANLYESFNPLGSRNTNIDLSNPNNKSLPLEKLMNPIDAYDLYMERTVRAINHDLFKRNTVDNILAAQGDKVDGLQLRLKQWPESGGATELTPKQIGGIRRAMLEKSINDPFENLISVNRGGKYEFYVPADPALKGVLQQNPAVSIPLLRDINKTMRKLTTGSARPGFAVKNFLYDTSMIAYMRPKDSVYGTDYLMAMAARASGMSPQTFEKLQLEKIGRGIDNATLNAVPYALNMRRAISLFFRQNELMFAKALTNRLTATPDSIFAQASPEWVQSYAKNVMKAYENGTLSAMAQNHVVSLTAMEHSGQAVKDFDRFLSANAHMALDLIASPLHLPLVEYKTMLSSIHAAAKVGYAARMTEYLNWKHPNGVPADVMKTMMTDARTLTGDFSRIPGSKWLQAFNSISPYNNVMLRSMQRVTQAMTTDKTTTAFMVTGVAMPQLFSTWWMSNMAGKEGYNYYFHDRPLWQRMSNFIIPKPELLYATYVTGEKRKFDPKDYYELTMAQEFRPIAQTVTEAVRAIGLGAHNFGISNALGMGQNDKLSGLSWGQSLSNIGEAMSEAFGINLPGTITGAILAGTDKKLELGNMFKPGQPLFSPTPGMGVNRPGSDTMNINSDISRVTANIVGQTLGAQASTMLEALDTGVQQFKKGDGIYQKAMGAIFGAGKEYVQRTAYDTNVTLPYTSDIAPNAPLIGRGMEKVYRNTPQDEYVKQARTVVNMFNYNGSVKLPLAGQDPATQVVNQIGYTLKQLTGKNSALKPYNDQYSEYGKLLGENSGNKQVDYVTRTSERNQILLKVRGVVQNQAAEYDKMQTMIRNGPMGQAFKQVTGQDFSYEEFGKLANQAAKKQAQLPVQRRYTQP